MILDAGISNDVQLHSLPNFVFADPIIFSIEVIASVLALMGAFYFYKFYRITGSFHLLGPVIGFSFITLAEVLLAADVWLQSDLQIFNLFFWMRLLCLSYGFSFIALSYFYKHKEADKTTMMKVAALSAVALMIMTAAMVIVPPSFVLPPYNEVDEYFRIFNLFMLGYVFRSTLGSTVQQGRKEFMYIPTAYAVLWLGQYSALIYSLDGGIGAFIAQNIGKVIGLALFVGVLYQVSRGKKRIIKLERGE